MSIKFCNSLLNWIADLVQNKNKFICKLKKCIHATIILFGKQFPRLLWNVMRNLMCMIDTPYKFNIHGSVHRSMNQ